VVKDELLDLEAEDEEEPVEDEVELLVEDTDSSSLPSSPVGSECGFTLASPTSDASSASIGGLVIPVITGVIDWFLVLSKGGPLDSLDGVQVGDDDGPLDSFDDAQVDDEEVLLEVLLDTDSSSCPSSEKDSLLFVVTFLDESFSGSVCCSGFLPSKGATCCRSRIVTGASSLSLFDDTVDDDDKLLLEDIDSSSLSFVFCGICFLTVPVVVVVHDLLPVRCVIHDFLSVRCVGTFSGPTFCFPESSLAWLDDTDSSSL
jgi:hypothetical protein